MNNDLISREALKEELGKSTVTIIGWGKAVFLDKAYELIDNAPTVEPKKEMVPVCKVTFDKEQLQEIVDKEVAELVEDLERPQVNCKDCDGYEAGYSAGLKDAERPQGEWVSADDELPQDMQRVLIWFEYYRYGDFNCMYQTYGFGYVCDGKWSPFINGETGWQDYRVIAWQPLPEPYEGGAKWQQ